MTAAPLDRYLSMIAQAGPELESELVREMCEGSLYEFLREAWPVFDPSPFVGGWHLGAIAEHLEAVSSGQIKKLLINVRPRSGKTGLCAVAWPTWTWALQQRADRPLQGAGVRFLCGSYGANKAQEDGVTARRLIGSLWYQKLWGDRVKICFPADQFIQTETGPMPIGEIVRGRLRLKIPSWSEARQRVELRPIIGWHLNPGARIIRLTFDSGLSIRCTGDHELRISCGNWLAAGDMPVGASVPIIRHGASDISGRMIPRAAGSNRVDGPARYASRRREYVGSFEADAPGARYFGGDNGLPRLFPSCQSAMLPGVMDVLKSGAVLQVARGAVSADATAMSDLFTRRGRTYERHGNDLVNLDFDRFAIPSEVEMGISVAIKGSLHDLARSTASYFPPWPLIDDISCEGPNTAETGNFVSRKRWGIDQNLGRVISVEVLDHVDETFCISVEGNDNLLVGDNQAVIASNCRDRDNQERYDTTAGGSRINTGIPESLGKGGMIRLLDDPHKTSEVESETVRGAVIRGYKEIWSTRSNDPNIGAEVMIMQRQAEDDLSGYWLENYGNEMVHLCIPAWHESDRSAVTFIDMRGRIYSSPLPKTFEGETFWEDPREVDGESFWPERYGLRQRGVDEALGPFAFAGQIQQRPEPRGGGIIKREWWQAWPPDDAIERWTNSLGQVSYPPWELVIGYLDTAFTKKETNDWCAMTRWGVFGDDARRPRAMMCGAWRDRLNFSELIAKTTKTCKDGKIDVLVIENKAGGNWVAEEIIKEMRNGEWQVVLDTPTVDKVSRAHAAVPLFVDKAVYAPFMHEAGVWRAWAEMAISELEKFPMGRHDDLCFVGGTMIATKCGAIPIELVKAGDAVLTPVGWRPVVAAGFTGVRPVIDRAGLCGTPSHPVFSIDDEFIRLDTVTGETRLGRLTLCGLIQTIRRMNLSSTASSIGEWVVSDDTTSPSRAPTPDEGMRKGFTSLSGSMRMVRRSRQIMKSTIATATLLISAMIIWSAYQRASIVGCLNASMSWLNSRISRISDLLRVNGTSPQRVVIGIGEQPHHTLMPPAKRGASWSPNREGNACGVEVRFLSEAVGRKPVQMNVCGNGKVSGEGRDGSPIPTILPVYNLTVADAHCYYANGILVHNCDTITGALGYLRRNGLIKLGQEHAEDEDDERRFRGNSEGVADMYGVS